VISPTTEVNQGRGRKSTQSPAGSPVESPLAPLPVSSPGQLPITPTGGSWRETKVALQTTSRDFSARPQDPRTLKAYMDCT